LHKAGFNHWLIPEFFLLNSGWFPENAQELPATDNIFKQIYWFLKSHKEHTHHSIVKLLQTEVSSKKKTQCIM
jgi:hypothetical protein